ncbi:Translin [Patellaria atrata CBS 101060]|uniref:Translin n=1 Tax=Patellaria atrata CBS 101060 TaxID=1346257 RepID=A0A9P4S763_9PEZI|nr:Translin [Patellaria atrata CBS 101060]
MTDISKSSSASLFLPMFEGFRAELDEHHDRRERVIKASRDITAASKKIIFSLQRIKKLNEPIPNFVTKANAQHWDNIAKQYKTISPDLQDLNTHRYERNITGGNQELMESLSFQHYLSTQTLISYDDACAKVSELSEKGKPVQLSIEDYVLGIFDMVGELMRFAITAMATGGELPGGSSTSTENRKVADEDTMEVDSEEKRSLPPRNALSDMRELRTYLEYLEVPRGTYFGKDVDKKMEVMRTCVEKVENALYGLVVRGSERPKGWIPEFTGSSRGPEPVEAV